LLVLSSRRVKYAQVNDILHNPSKWQCETTGTTDDLWVCLGCAMVTFELTELICSVHCSLVVHGCAFRSSQADRWRRARPATTPKKRVTRST